MLPLMLLPFLNLTISRSCWLSARTTDALISSGLMACVVALFCAHDGIATSAIMRTAASLNLLFFIAFLLLICNENGDPCGEPQNRPDNNRAHRRLPDDFKSLLDRTHFFDRLHIRIIQPHDSRVF